MTPFLWHDREGLGLSFQLLALRERGASRSRIWRWLKVFADEAVLTGWSPRTVLRVMREAMVESFGSGEWKALCDFQIALQALIETPIRVTRA